MHSRVRGKNYAGKWKVTCKKKPYINLRYTNLLMYMK